MKLTRNQVIAAAIMLFAVSFLLAAQALGVSLRTVKAWEAGFAAPAAFLGLACAALAAGLGP